MKVIPYSHNVSGWGLLTRTESRSSYRFQRIVLLVASCVVFTTALAEDRQRPDERIIFAADDTGRCLKCHGMSNFAFRDSAAGALHNYTVNEELFRGSIHGKLHCQQCHAEIKKYPHQFEGQRKKVSCGNECHVADSAGNIYTHQREVNDFSSSVHRKGLTGENPDDPECTSCHGGGNPHAVAQAKKTMSLKEKMGLCITCHDDEALSVRNKLDPQAVSSYRKSFHYKAIKFGETGVAVCQDCHTVHRVLPKDSASSSISVGNIANTCGQEHCHSGAAMNFAMSGANHLDLRIEREPILWYLEKFFIILTAGTMAMLLIGIILDVQRKFGWVIVIGNIGKRLAPTLRVLGDIGTTLLKYSKRILID